MWRWGSVETVEKNNLSLFGQKFPASAPPWAGEMVPSSICFLALVYWTEIWISFLVSSTNNIFRPFLILNLDFQKLCFYWDFFLKWLELFKPIVKLSGWKFLREPLKEVQPWFYIDHKLQSNLSLVERQENRIWRPAKLSSETVQPPPTCLNLKHIIL